MFAEVNKRVGGRARGGAQQHGAEADSQVLYGHLVLVCMGGHSTEMVQ